VSINVFKPRDYFTYHQVKQSTFLHESHITFMRFVRISEERATVAINNISRLVLYNRGGECLLRYIHCVLI
jgi:hypothetical protein